MSSRVSSIRLAVFKITVSGLALFASVSGAAALEPPTHECIKRPVTKLDFARFREQAIAILGPGSIVLADANKTNVLDEELKNFYRLETPYDIFCVLSPAVKNLDDLELNAAGGSIFVFASHGFQFNNLQSNPFTAVVKWTDGTRHRFNFIESIANRLINDYVRPYSYCPNDTGENYYAVEQCWLNYEDKLEEISQRYEPEYANYKFELKDRIRLFNTFSAPDKIAPELNKFVSNVVVHEMLSEPEYSYDSSDPKTQKQAFVVKIRNDILDVANIRTAQQWLTALSVAVLRGASYRVAAEIVDLLRDATPELVPLPVLPAASLYPALISENRREPFEHVFSKFLCETNYKAAFAQTSTSEDLYRLARYRQMLCGPRTLTGSTLFAADRVAKTAFSDLTKALEALQEDINAQELQKALNDLKLIQMDQVLLLNDLKTYAATDTFTKKIAALQSAIDDLEKQAKKKNILTVINVVQKLVSAAVAIYSGGTSMVALLQALPVGAFAESLAYVKANKDTFKNASKDLSSGGSDLGDALDGLEILFTDFKGTIDDLKAQKAAVEAAFAAVLYEIAALRSKYYKAIDEAVANALRLDQSNNVQTARVATELADITAFVSLAYAGARYPSNRAAVCKDAIELGLKQGTKNYIAELLSSCLKITNQVGDTQTCINAGDGGKPEVTVVRRAKETAGVRLAAGDKLSCFETVR